MFEFVSACLLIKKKSLVLILNKQVTSPKTVQSKSVVKDFILFPNFGQADVWIFICLSIDQEEITCVNTK